MMPYEVALITTLLILCFVVRYSFTAAERVGAPFTAGFVATFMLEEVGKKYDRLFIGMLFWALVSLALGVGGPLVAGNLLWFVNPVGFTVTVNYTLLVPLLFATYIYAVDSAGRFFPDLREERPYFWYFQGFLVVATAIIIHVAAVSEITDPSPNSPWVNGSGTLTFLGILYYAVIRGLNTYMALCLIMTIVHVGFRAARDSLPAEDRPETEVMSQVEKYLHVDQWQIRPEPKAMVSSMLLCIVLGSAVTSIHGLGLYWTGSQPRADPSIFLRTTWVMWLLLTVMMVVFAAMVLIWLRNRVRWALSQVERIYLKRMREEMPDDKFLAARLTLRKNVESVSSWPMLREASLALLVGLLVEAMTLVVTGFLGKP